MTTTDRKITEPLWTVTGVLGTLVVVALALSAVFTLAGSGSIGGFGHLPVICINQPRISYGGDGIPPLAVGAAQPGATLSLEGTLQACAPHPAAFQRLLYTLMSAPSALFWVAVLFLLWRLVRAADRSGPFTLAVAARMRRLGWVVLLGALAATAAQGAATDALLNTMLTAQNALGDAVFSLPRALPVPLLVWAALLSFARIIRLGVAMDEDIQGTV